MSGLLGLPALVAGLILDLAGSSWFTGAHTVGLILIIVGGFFCLLTLLIFLGGLWAVGSKF